jgi:hypothetical protein
MGPRQSRARGTEKGDEKATVVGFCRRAAVDDLGGRVKIPPIPGHLKNGEGRNRTGDTTIFSRVLYQLSYLAAPGDGSEAIPLVWAA